MVVEILNVRGKYARVLFLALAVLFPLISFYIYKFDIAARGFDSVGYRLLAYHFARIGFAIYLTIACHSLGYWTLAGLGQKPILNGRKVFITCFFLGASIYGIVFSFLGLFQLISAAAALLATLPAVLFARRPVEMLRVRQAIVGVFGPISDGGVLQPGRLTAIAVTVMAGVSALLFIVTRVVFIANPDGNIWEHYLHFYRDVLDRGSTLPGQVWHHFYNSKGGGLVFLADALSDVFSVQLVSACMVVAASTIIFDVLSDNCRDRRWPFFGLIIYFTFLFGDVADGGMFRVHGIILGYAAFFFWGWQRVQPGETDARPVFISMAASLAYMGFYQPVSVPVFAPVFLLMAVCQWIGGGRFEFRLGLLFGVIIACGTSVVILINWSLTGLMELTPIKLLWSIAQKDKVREVFGTGGVDFFLAVNNDLSDVEGWSHRVYQTIHHPRLFNSLTLLVGLIVAGRALARFPAKKPLEKNEVVVFELLAFIVPLLLLTVFFPSPSVERMGIYSIVSVVCCMVLIWDQFIESVAGGLALVFHRGSTGETTYIPLKQVGLFIACVLGGLMIITTEVRSMPPFDAAIYRFGQARVSLKGAMELMEHGDPGLVSGTTVKSVAEFRKASGYSGAILSLVYDPSYAYFLPEKGFVSQPTYALVKDPKRLLADDSAVVATDLRERKIEYLSLNLPSRLFTTVAFTALFDAKNVNSYFDLAYEDGDFFILRLKDTIENSSHSLPDYLLTSLEFKRSGVLHFPFSNDFDVALRGDGQQIKTLEEFEMLRARFVQELHDFVFAKMIDHVALPASKAALYNLLETTTVIVDKFQINPLLGWPNSRQGRDGKFDIAEDRIRSSWISLVREEIRKEYQDLIGPRFANLAERCDERIPFDIDRPPDAVCR